MPKIAPNKEFLRRQPFQLAPPPSSSLLPFLLILENEIVAILISIFASFVQGSNLDHDNGHRQQSFYPAFLLFVQMACHDAFLEWKGAFALQV